MVRLKNDGVNKQNVRIYLMKIKIRRLFNKIFICPFRGHLPDTRWEHIINDTITLPRDYNKRIESYMVVYCRRCGKVFERKRADKTVFEVLYPHLAYLKKD